MAYNSQLWDALEDDSIIRVTPDKVVVDHNTQRVLQLSGHFGMDKYPYFSIVNTLDEWAAPRTNTISAMRLGPLRILSVGELTPATYGGVSGPITYTLNAFNTVGAGGIDFFSVAGCHNHEAVIRVINNGVLGEGHATLTKVGEDVTLQLNLPENADFTQGTQVGHRGFSIMWVEPDLDTRKAVTI